MYTKCKCLFLQMPNPCYHHFNSTLNVRRETFDSQKAKKCICMCGCLSRHVCLRSCSLSMMHILYVNTSTHCCSVCLWLIVLLCNLFLAVTWLAVAKVFQFSGCLVVGWNCHLLVSKSSISLLFYVGRIGLILQQPNLTNTTIWGQITEKRNN